MPREVEPARCACESNMEQAIARARSVAAPWLDDCSDTMVGLIVEAAQMQNWQRDFGPLPAFNPVGGASRGVGWCTCPCGKGTDPGCRVHP